MESRPHLRRSKSLKSAVTATNMHMGSSPSQLSHLEKQRGSVSRSADDILVDVSHVTDVEQHGVLLVYNGFYKTETLRTLVGASFEQGMRSCRERSDSFHNRPRARTVHCIHETNSPVRRLERCCEPQTPRLLPDTTFDEIQPRQIEKRPTSLVASKSYTGDTAKEKRGVQLKRCLSLYDRSRTPHLCNHHASHTSAVMKPSPWTYGGTTNHKSRDVNMPSSKKSQAQISSDFSRRLRKSAFGSCSVDSVDSGASWLNSSLGSICSPDSDPGAANKPRTLSRRPIIIANYPKSNGKTALQCLRNRTTPRQSLIPRPVRPLRAPPQRSRSFSCDEFSRGVPIGDGAIAPRINRTSKAPLMRGKTLVRSISASEKLAFTKSGQGDCSSISEKRTGSIGKKTIAVSVSSDSLDSVESWNTTTTRKVFVSESEINYPEPRPCRVNKSEIFNPRDFQHVDQHALEAPETLLKSFNDLLDYLLKDLSHTLSRVRVIYRWIISQHIPLEVSPREITPDTPLGFLYNIRERKASYSELFATMCRRAEIPCVIIHGVAKSIAYNVGDKVTHRKMKNSWNAVYIDDVWHFVHPYWARQSARGYTTGCWAVVESDDFHDDNSESKETVQHTTNDFFFLTDAEQFITKCFPDEPSWQLLETTLSKIEFEQLPFLQPAFYELNLKLKSHQHCVIRAEHGKVEICIEMPSEKASSYRFKYKLFIHRDWGAEGEYDHILLDHYLLHYFENGVAVFEIRFPISGFYKLELHCYDTKNTMCSNWICDYKIICPEPMPNCEPLPIVPAIGWGPSTALENAGLECLTHKTGVINVDAEPVTFVRFALPKEKEMSVVATLLANKISRDELQGHVTVEQDGEHAVIKVAPPEEGEYALQIFVQDRGSDKKQNVCNYLMHRTKIVEDPELADIRQRLVEATEGGELDALTLWVDRFQEKNMEDRGDLTEAKRKLQVAKLNRDIKEAIARKDLNLLEKTMASCSDTSIRRSLGNLAAEAEAMRSRLRRLKRLRHAVLEMSQKTISEMRSYPKPPQVVHGVMAATFMLLGHKEGQLKKWGRIQGLISKKGKESLKRRVADFKSEDVSPEVLQRVRAILAKYDLETVQIASIGAATFYQWASTMAGEADV